VVHVAATARQGLEELKAAIWHWLQLVRVYTKVPGKPFDRTAPYVVHRGATLLELAERIHRDLAEKLDFARCGRAAAGAARRARLRAARRRRGRGPRRMSGPGFWDERTPRTPTPMGATRARSWCARRGGSRGAGSSHWRRVRSQRDLAGAARAPGRRGRRVGGRGAPAARRSRGRGAAGRGGPGRPRGVGPPPCDAVVAVFAHFPPAVRRAFTAAPGRRCGPGGWS